MDFITLLIVWIITFAITTLLTPKPKITNARPAGLGDFSFPTATEGRPVPLVWGTVKISGPNVVWYGDLQPKPITKGVKTGMFSSKKQTIGYKYYIGLQFALCRGIVDFLSKIWINDKVVFEGQLGAEGAVVLDNPNLFGGKDQGGGIKGTFRFYTGGHEQAVNSYMNNTPPDFLWQDNFGDGGLNEPMENFKGTGSDAYYLVANKGQTGGHGPGSSITGIQNVGTAEGTDGKHFRSLNADDSVGGSPGDLNRYSALLMHPDRPRLGDNVKAIITFRAKDGSATDFDSRELWVGVKCKDTGDHNSNYGVYAIVMSQSRILVEFESPTSSGLTTIVDLNAPADFTAMSSTEHSLELRVDGITVTVKLDGLAIYTGDTAELADIPTADYQGIVVGVCGNLNVAFFSGSPDWTFVGIYTLSIDSTLRNIISDAPAYRGTCYGVWEGGYLGNSTQISPWAFEIRRCPNGLSLSTGHNVVNGFDANPMSVIYEILTDPDWGLGFNDADIDTTNFIEAALTLSTEGNGVSMVVDNQLECQDFLKEIERQIDGTVYLDRASGLFKVKLVRADYVLDDVPLLNKSNVKEVKDFTRGSWHNTSNNIRVQFSDRAKDYNDTYALAQDVANIALQGNLLVNVEEKYPGIKDRHLANQIAWRGLRLAAYPLAKCSILTNRTMHFLNQGDVVKITDESLSITDMAMRVVRVDLGKLDDGVIGLDLVQDVFFYDLPSMADPPDSFWLDPEHSPSDVGVADRIIFEAPLALCVRAEENPGAFNRIWVGAHNPGDRSSRMEVWTNDASAGYLHDMDVEGYLEAGSLTADLAASTVQGTDAIQLDATPDNQSTLTTDSQSRIASEIGIGLYNIAKIDDEFIGFQTAAVSGSKVDLTGAYRGLMDTVPTPHAAGTKVFFLSVAGNITTNSFGATDSVAVKMLTDGQYGTLPINLASPTTIIMNDRARRPYPPTAPSVNGVLWEDAASIDVQQSSSLETYHTDSDVPATLNYNDGITDEVGVRFKPLTNGFIYGVKFYKSTSMTGTHVGTLWDDTSSALATVTFSGETASGWQTAFFSSPVAVTSGTTYRTSIFSQTNFINFTVSQSYPITHGNLQVTDGVKKAFVGSGGWPTFTDTTDYFVVPMFSTEENLLDHSGISLSFVRRDFRTGDEVVSVLSEAGLPADFPTANTTEYQVEVVNDPAGTPATLYTTALNAGTNSFVLKRQRILRFTAGVIPTNLRLSTITSHTVDGDTLTALQNLNIDFTVTTSELASMFNWAVLANGVASADYTTAATGTFTLKVGTPLATGAIQASVNGGSYSTIIAATTYSGTLSITSGDTIKIKHTQTGSTDSETLVELLNPSAVGVAYAVLTY